MSDTQPTQNRCFFDINIWLYAFAEVDDKRKSSIAKSIIQSSEVVVSIQVVNEVCVNMLKKTSIPEQDIQALVTSFYEKYTVTNIDKSILIKASELRRQYSLSYCDSLILANALVADCVILYSEDMHDGLLVEQKLTIANPF